MYNISKIINKIKKYDIVTFDMFDTLITRKTNNPTQIFDMVELTYNNENKVKIKDFKNKRIKAEKDIINTYPTIDEIYRKLEKEYSKSIANKLKTIEIELEKKYCVPIEEMKQIFEYCIKENKKIFIISDMYLTSDILNDILNKNGYNGYENIYVSCEQKTTKIEHKIFKQIKSEYKKQKIIHIGDSTKADFIAPKLAMISSIKIKKNYFQHNNSNILKLSKLLCNKNRNYFYKLGAKLLGPILILFATWLNNQFENRNIKKIYFLSREGKIYKDVFDTLYENKYTTYYFHASRKAITMANYNNNKNLTNQEILKYFTIKKNSTVKETLTYLGIDIECENNVLNNNIYKETNNNNLFSKIKEQLNTQSKEQNELLNQYIEINNMSGNIALVDIGWNGTMQKNLTMFLKNNKHNFNIYGFYFSLFKKINNGYGFIHEIDIAYKSIKNNPILIENLFQNVEGSTIGYVKKDNKIEPLKRKIEFDDYSIEAIKNINNGIHEIVNEYKNNGYIINQNTEKKYYLGEIQKFIDIPDKKSIIKFIKFKYSDIAEDTMICKTINIKKGIYKSGWKAAYFKYLFKIKLNYGNLVNYLKR